MRTTTLPSKAGNKVRILTSLDSPNFTRSSSGNKYEPSSVSAVRYSSVYNGFVGHPAKGFWCLTRSVLAFGIPRITPFFCLHQILIPPGNAVSRIDIKNALTGFHSISRFATRERKREKVRSSTIHDDVKRVISTGQIACSNTIVCNHDQFEASTNVYAS